MSDRPVVLLVDDERQIHRFLRPTLEASGYAVVAAETGADALHAVAAQPPALILLDLGLPDMDGQTVLRRLRAVGAIPVIVLSARDRPHEKIIALDSGADDYVEKPFDVGELLARMRTALRHAGAAREAPPVLRFGNLELNLEKRIVLVDGQTVSLTPREYDLLAILARSEGRVITHRALLTAVWGPAHAKDVQYLRVYVGQLRQKLGQVAGRLIVTEAGVGYRLAEA